MFGLLSKKPAQRFKNLAGEYPKNYTRFHTKQAQTRFPTKSPQRNAVEKQFETVPVPAPKPVLIKPGKIDENAHLYAEAKVSVSILRKALPQRFERMGNILVEAAS